MDNIIHVYPVVGTDDKPHIATGATEQVCTCWCSPTPLHEPNGVIWVHHDWRRPKRPEPLARNA